MKNLSTVRAVCDSLQLSTSLTITTVDRHLLSSLLAINVRMIQIPVAVDYDIKENNTKYITPLLITLCVIQLHSAVVLTYWDQNADHYL
jgi:hypothetical protein